MQLLKIEGRSKVDITLLKYTSTFSTYVGYFLLFIDILSSRVNVNLLQANHHPASFARSVEGEEETVKSSYEEDVNLYMFSSGSHVEEE